MGGTRIAGEAEAITNPNESPRARFIEKSQIPNKAIAIASIVGANNTKSMTTNP